MLTPSSEGSVDVKVIQEKDFSILDENINQTSTYYIVDPGNTKDDCNPPANDAFSGVLQLLQKSAMNQWNPEELRRIVSNDKESVHLFGVTNQEAPSWFVNATIPNFATFPLHQHHNMFGRRYAKSMLHSCGIL